MAHVYTIVMLLKALITAGVVFAAMQLIPRKKTSLLDSLIVSAVSAGALLAINMVMHHKPRVCRAQQFEMFDAAPNVSADEAGLVFGAVVQPPPNERVQNIYYSGDTLSLTMPDNRFIGKAKSGDAAAMSLGQDQSLGSFRIELYNAYDMLCKGVANGFTAALSAIPLNSIVVLMHTVAGQDRYLTVQSG